jgi:hypothetical protein
VGATKLAWASPKKRPDPKNNMPLSLQEKGQRKEGLKGGKGG